MQHTVPAQSPHGYAGRPVEKTPPWHGLVVADVLLNNLSTGLFLVTALGDLARPDLFAPVTPFAYPIALAVLLADLVCLVLDLGDPLRFHHMLRVFKPQSPMSLGTWFLTAYSLPLAAVAAIEVGTLVGLLPTDPDAWNVACKALVVVGIPFAMGSLGYKGVLFSTSSQPGWREARWFGSYLFASALVLGCAEALVLAELTGASGAAVLLRTALVILLALHVLPLVLLYSDVLPVLNRQHLGAERWKRAAVVLGLGVVIPLLLALIGSGLVLSVVVLVLLIVAGYTARHVIVLMPHHVHARVAAH